MSYYPPHQMYYPGAQGQAPPSNPYMYYSGYPPPNGMHGMPMTSMQHPMSGMMGMPGMPMHPSMMPHPYVMAAVPKRKDRNSDWDPYPGAKVRIRKPLSCDSKTEAKLGMYFNRVGTVKLIPVHPNTWYHIEIDMGSGRTKDMSFRRPFFVGIDDEEAASIANAEEMAKAMASQHQSYAYNHAMQMQQAAAAHYGMAAYQQQHGGMMPGHPQQVPVQATAAQPQQQQHHQIPVSQAHPPTYASSSMPSTAVVVGQAPIHGAVLATSTNSEASATPSSSSASSASSSSTATARSTVDPSSPRKRDREGTLENGQPPVVRKLKTAPIVKPLEGPTEVQDDDDDDDDKTIDDDDDGAKQSGSGSPLQSAAEQLMEFSELFSSSNSP